MTNLAKLADPAIESKPLGGLTVGEFRQILSSSYPTPPPTPLPPPSEDLEYVSDIKARCIASGDPEKPLSKVSFNEIRRQYGIRNYSPLTGRTLYKRSELYAAFEQAARSGTLEPKARKK